MPPPPTPSRYQRDSSSSRSSTQRVIAPTAAAALSKRHNSRKRLLRRQQLRVATEHSENLRPSRHRTTLLASDLITQFRSQKLGAVNLTSLTCSSSKSLVAMPGRLPIVTNVICAKISQFHTWLFFTITHARQYVVGAIIILPALPVIRIG